MHKHALIHLSHHQNTQLQPKTYFTSRQNRMTLTFGCNMK